MPEIQCKPCPRVPKLPIVIATTEPKQLVRPTHASIFVLVPKEPGLRISSIQDNPDLWYLLVILEKGNRRERRKKKNEENEENNKQIRLNLPGGKLEFGENPFRAACREFLEETNNCIDLSELHLPVTSSECYYWSNNNKMLYSLKIYVFIGTHEIYTKLNLINSKFATTPENGETERIELINVRDLLDYHKMSPQERTDRWKMGICNDIFETAGGSSYIAHRRVLTSFKVVFGTYRSADRAIDTDQSHSEHDPDGWVLQKSKAASHKHANKNHSPPQRIR